MSRKKPAPDLIISAFTRVFDALWVGAGFPIRTCANRRSDLPHSSFDAMRALDQRSNDSYGISPARCERADRSEQTMNVIFHALATVQAAGVDRQPLSANTFLYGELS
jgi:hypothetical protein